MTLEDLEVGYGNVTQTRGGQAVTLTKVNPMSLGVVDYYFGPLLSDPNVRPDNSPLQAGDSYYNIAIHDKKIYDGDIWINYHRQPVCTGNVGNEVSYTSGLSDENQYMIVSTDNNAFSIEKYTLADGATLIIEDGATYKVI